MMLINLLCLIFLTSCACALSTPTPSDDIITSTTDSSPTGELSHDTLSTIGTQPTIEATTVVLSHDTLSTIGTQPTAEATTVVLSHDIPSTIETQRTTEATTVVLSHDTLSTIETLPTTEATTEVVTVGDEAEDDVVISGINNRFKLENTQDGAKTHQSLKTEPLTPSSPDNDDGHEAELLEGGIGGKEKNMTNIAGNESTISRGKAAGILVSSCIIAVALIWISKIIYTRYQSKTYDLRQDIQMRNP